MSRLKHLWNRLMSAAAPLARDVRSLLPASISAAALMLASLLVMNGLMNLTGPKASRLIDLVNTALVAPLSTALLCHRLHAVWNRQTISLPADFAAVKSRIWRTLGCALCIWALGTFLDLFVRLFSVLLGLIATLTGWIPGVGYTVGAIAALLSEGLALAFELFLLFFTVTAFSLLLGRGLWGEALARETLKLLWGGRTDTFPAFALLLMGRIAVLLVSRILLAIPMGFAAAALSLLVQTAYSVLCVTAIAALCQKEHDRQYGWSF